MGSGRVGFEKWLRWIIVIPEGCEPLAPGGSNPGIPGRRPSRDPIGIKLRKKRQYTGKTKGKGNTNHH